MKLAPLVAFLALSTPVPAKEYVSRIFDGKITYVFSEQTMKQHTEIGVSIPDVVITDYNINGVFDQKDTVQFKIKPGDYARFELPEISYEVGVLVFASDKGALKDEGQKLFDTYVSKK